MVGMVAQKCLHNSLIDNWSTAFITSTLNQLLLKTFHVDHIIMIDNTPTNLSISPHTAYHNIYGFTVATSMASSEPYCTAHVSIYTVYTCIKAVYKMFGYGTVLQYYPMS